MGFRVLSRKKCLDMMYLRKDWFFIPLGILVIRWFPRINESVGEFPFSSNFLDSFSQTHLRTRKNMVIETTWSKLGTNWWSPKCLNLICSNFWIIRHRMLNFRRHSRKLQDNLWVYIVISDQIRYQLIHCESGFIESPLSEIVFWFLWRWQ